MPQFPLVQGSKTSKNARYSSAFPVNMVPTPFPTEGSSGYLRSFPGITHHYDCDGASYAAHYNDLTQTEYRISGAKLYANGESVAEIVGGKLSTIAHSPNSTAFVDDEKLKYFRDGKVTELKNWYEGENYKSFPDYKFTVKFEGVTHVDIPSFNPGGGFSIKLKIYLTSMPTRNSFILGAKTSYDGDTTGKKFVGVFFNSDDNKLYYRLKNDPDLEDPSENDIEIGPVSVGTNFYTITSTESFEHAIQYIGGVSINGTMQARFTDGEIERVEMSASITGDIVRDYEMIKSVSRDSDDVPATPTTRVLTNKADSGSSGNGQIVGGSSPWTAYHSQEGSIKSPATDFDLTGVIDIDRHEGRYVWINKNRLGCTAISKGKTGDPDTVPEERPDYLAPFYAVESDPDENKAVKSWQGKYIAVFGRNTTQWFGLTGNEEQIYLPQKSMQTAAGIVGTHAICRYKDAFAAVGSTKGGTLQVMIITPGTFKKISTSSVDIIVNKYKESELQDLLLETFLFNNHEFVIMHLPNETLVWDGSQAVWFELKSGTEGSNPYVGRHVIYNQEEGLTIGDKSSGRVGKIDDNVSSQYGELVEFLLYTPFVRVNTDRGVVPLFDLKFDSIFGHVNEFQSIFISFTTDGLMYGNEYRLRYNDPRTYNSRPMIGNLGSVADSVGFKLRVQSKEPVNLSGFSVRIGYGG